MAIGGKERQIVDFTKKVGFFEGKVVAINPTKEELEALLSRPIEKEPEYLSDDDDGNKKVAFSFWIEDLKTGLIFNKRFTMTNKKRDTSKTGKTQYINDVGSTTWAEDENALKDEKYKIFTTRDFRDALIGEEKLYNFLRALFNSLDFKDPSTELKLDNKKLFKGNMADIKDAIAAFPNATICALATIRTVPGENGANAKEYQSLYEEFLPGNCIKYFAPGVKSRPDFVNNYIKNLNGEYGCKDFYKVEEIDDYDSTENVVAGSSTHATAPTPQTGGNTYNSEVVDDLPF